MKCFVVDDGYGGVVVVFGFFNWLLLFFFVLEVFVELIENCVVVVGLDFLCFIVLFFLSVSCLIEMF